MIRENAIPRRIVFSWRIVGGKNVHRPAYKIAFVIQYIKRDCGWEQLIHIYKSVIALVFTKKRGKCTHMQVVVTSNLYLRIDTQLTLIEEFQVKRVFPEFCTVSITKDFFVFSIIQTLYKVVRKREEKNTYFLPFYYLF